MIVSNDEDDFQFVYDFYGAEIANKVLSVEYFLVAIVVSFDLLTAQDLMIVNSKPSPCVSFADELSHERRLDDRPNSLLTDTPSNACSYSEIISKWVTNLSIHTIYPVKVLAWKKWKFINNVPIWLRYRALYKTRKSWKENCLIKDFSFVEWYRTPIFFSYMQKKS